MNHFLVNARSLPASKFFAVLLGVCSTASCLAETYYVSKSGNDRNDGLSTGTSFLTIQKASDVVQAGDVVEILEGTYREQVNVSRSGNTGNPITFRSFGDDKVVLSGCDLITGWTNSGNNIWTTEVDWNAKNDRAANTLFVNGAHRYEARQGAENDWLDIDDWGQILKGRLKSSSSTFVADDLKGFGDDFWVGAKIKFHVVDWEFLTRTITDYDSDSGRITFDQPTPKVTQKQQNGYYIYDTLKALDKPGEWFKEDGGDTLFYKAESGQNPNNLEIEFKRRASGFNLRGRKYIRLEGLTFRGASIDTDAGTDYNIYQRNILYAYDKANFGRFQLKGDFNIFRENEVTETWTSSISVRGKRNALINNYFHNIGFNGTTRVLTMTGEEHLVSHNTFRKFARSVLDGFPSRSEFKHNLFEDAGRLSWDTGVFDSDGSNGNNSFCIFHHNVFRNTAARGITQTYYGRNNNTVFHHNILYDWQSASTRMPFHADGIDFRQVYHNTFISNAPPGGIRNGLGAVDPKTVVQTRYNNNLQISLDKVEVLGVDLRGNHNYSTDDFENFSQRDFRLSAGSAAIDSGIILPGVNDGFNGAGPDAGAIEFGDKIFAYGHDFANPPSTSYAWSALPGMNLYTNSQFNSGITDWTIESGSPDARDRNSWNLGAEGNSLTGFLRTKSVQLSPGESISRVFTDLQPNTLYTVGAAARMINQVTQGALYDASSSGVQQGSHRGESFAHNFSANSWARYDDIDFGLPGQFDLIEVLHTRATLNGSLAGGIVEVRVDAVDGPIVAVFDDLKDDPTQKWLRSRKSLSRISGVRTIYVSVKGSNTINVGVGSIRLLKKSLPSRDLLNISLTAPGSDPVTEKIGWTDWELGYQTFSFLTGPSATEMTMRFENTGFINGYLDRLFLVEGLVKTGDNVSYIAGEASQSSTLANRRGGSATDQDYTNFSETRSARNSWWQVRFASDLTIGDIEIFNRSDSRYNELSNFTVSVWDKAPGQGGKRLWQKSYFRTGSVGRGGSLKIPAREISSIDSLTRLGASFGRVVRIQLNSLNNAGNGHLSLAEVVIRTADNARPVGNLSLHGTASQSTDFRFVGNLADEANNGVANPAGVFSHTKSELGQWWQVKLERSATIDQILIVNRVDAGFRIGDFKVSVWDRLPGPDATELWNDTFSYSPDTALISTVSITDGGSLRINGSRTSNGVRLDSVVGANYVRVEKTSSGILSLSEVQVWVSPTLVEPSLTKYVYDLGPSSSLFSGAASVTPTVFGDLSFDGTISAIDRGPNIGQNKFNRDFIRGAAPATFNHALTNGRYRITLNMSDPSADLDNMYVMAEGSTLLSDIDRPIGQNGTFATVVDVNDGELNLEFGDADTVDQSWAVNRIVLTRLPRRAPVITPSRLVVAPNDPLKFENPENLGEVYYTVDGSDPRLPDGTISPDALMASRSSRNITEDTTVTARTLLGEEWSDSTEKRFYPDSDGDSLPDSIEFSLYGHATDNADGSGDYDKDGQNDLTEWIAGTDLESSISLFTSTVESSEPLSDGSIEYQVSWPSSPDRIYSIWISDSLVPSDWSELATDIVPDKGNITSRSILLTGERQFFRIGSSFPSAD